MPVSPFYRLLWPDGTSFDYSNDDVHAVRILAFEPFDSNDRGNAATTVAESR